MTLYKPLIIKTVYHKTHYSIDNLVFDEWFPIIGSRTFSVYSLICRLAGHECRLSDMARHLGMTLGDLHLCCEILAMCQLINFSDTEQGKFCDVLTPTPPTEAIKFRLKAYQDSHALEYDHE